MISAFIIKLPNQPRHVRQVEHPKFVDEAIAPKSLYMVDEEAGRIGNHVRQFGQTRTHFSGGKLWFGGWGVEPFDGKRRINLFAPIAGDLPNNQFFGSWIQLPPSAGKVSCKRTTGGWRKSVTV